MQTKKALKIISEELLEIAIMVESAEDSEAPIIDVFLAKHRLDELSQALDKIRESYLVV